MVRLEDFTDIYHQREQVEDEHIAMMLNMVDRGGRSKRLTPLKPLKRKYQESIKLSGRYESRRDRPSK